MDIITVIIAEDEPPIARFIKGLTEGDKCFQVIAMCESGEEAIEAAARLRPRLLITDIRMAGMSGLELIRKIRMENQEMRVIIISGFKMFEYAREAISLGIEDYITKPIEMEEFSRVLEGVKRYYRREERTRRQILMEKALRNKDGELFADLFYGEGGLGNRFQLLMIYLSGDTEDHLEGYIRDPAVSGSWGNLHWGLGNKGASSPEGVLVLGYRNSIIFITPYEQTSCMDAPDSRLRKILELAGGGTVAGILVEEMAPDEQSIGQIREIYRCICKLAVPGKKVKAVFRHPEEIQPREYGGDEEAVKRILTAVQAGNWVNFCARLEKLFLLWGKTEASVYQIKKVLHVIVSGLEQTGVPQEETIAWNEYIDDCIQYSDDYGEVKDNILTFFHENIIKKEDRENGAKDGRKLFDAIVSLIDKNRGINYSLQEISARYGVSQPYVRKIFKNCAGVTYNEYVLNEKIRLAMELMELNPVMLIKDVADVIGFEQLYFSTVFNKSVGMSPTQYKLEMVRKKSIPG